MADVPPAPLLGERSPLQALQGMRHLGGGFRKDEGDLQRRYLDLEREWTAYKKSAPPRYLHSSQSTTRRSYPSSIAPITEPCENLPKLLMYSLQFDGTPTEAKEIAMEKIASIWSVALRGRSLLEALEQAQNETCSDCSSGVLQGGSSSCSCSPSSSSSSSCSSERSVGGESHRHQSRSISPELFKAAGSSAARRWMLTILLSVLSLAAIFFIMESLSEEGGDWLTPT